MQHLLRFLTVSPLLPLLFGCLFAWAGYWIARKTAAGNKIGLWIAVVLLVLWQVVVMPYAAIELGSSNPSPWALILSSIVFMSGTGFLEGIILGALMHPKPRPPRISNSDDSSGRSSNDS